VRHILDGHAPDLILSGVNRGSNVADDISYSGTIAGAIEGTILGIPSIALSQSYGPPSRQRPHWTTALRFGADLVRRLLAEGIPKGILININFPDCVPDDVKGVAVSAQGKRDQDWLRIDERFDGRGNPYYWIAFSRGPRVGATHGSDLAALADRRIAVTPLRLDMTAEPFMTRLAELFADAEADAEAK
jgi:5'-nucleotidase